MLETDISGELDAVEQAIIGALSEDGRLSTVELARRVGVTEATARKKLRRLIEDGVIAVKAMTDPLRRGKGVAAIIGLEVARKHLDEVAARLASYDFVERVYSMTGPYDLIIELTLGSTAELHSFLLDELKSLDGITDTESFMIGRVYKHHGVVKDAHALKEEAARFVASFAGRRKK
ncbi:Lrp/AsnC family transcriptional regulator [Rhodoligotrophos ferricapiens]|uniref:Lrp/AsnC family transcriptional regulator n=1 Tax=Rhodoligotrophos ferricapiens TaxID=3069264 RepID=UPI00315C7322